MILHMKYASWICKICKNHLKEEDEYCPDCGKDGIKIKVET